MNASIYRISLDIHEPHSGVSLDAKRGDTKRKIYITLTDGGFPYHISEECYAVFTAKKPDGNNVSNPCIIEGNTIIYKLTPQTVAAVGFLNCEVSLYGADDSLITSPCFSLVVNEKVHKDGELVVSASEVEALTNLISEATTSIHESKETMEEGKALIEDLEESREELDQKVSDTKASADAAKMSENAAYLAAGNASKSADSAMNHASFALSCYNQTRDCSNIAAAASDRAEAAAQRAENAAGQGSPDAPGEDGGYYTPSVKQIDESTMEVSFTASKDGMDSVSSQRISLPAGKAGAKGDKGDTGAQGIQGETGAQGPQGEAGPAGPEGPQGPQGDKGEKGDPGPQGIQGEKGEKGDPGEQGPQGIPGEKGDKGDTGATGPQGPKGEKGDKGDKGDTGATGPQGPKGDTGPQGEQGIQGPKGADGKDYVLTAADKAEIVAAVLDSIPYPVFGTVGENNSITLSGSLPDGSYTLKYEMADGSFAEIGTITLGSGTPIVNLLETAVGTDGAVFNGTGYMDGYYLTGSSSANPIYVAAESGVAHFVTGYIPYTLAQAQAQTPIYVKGANIDTAQSHERIGFYPSLTHAEWLDPLKLSVSAMTVTKLSDGYFRIVPPANVLTEGGYNFTDIQFIRLSLSGSGAGVIITVGQEIPD